MCRADWKARWRGIERCKDDPLSEHGLRPDEVLVGGNPNSCDKFFEFQRQSPMTKAIVFDLDSCLAAAGEVEVVRTGVCGHPRGQAIKPKTGVSSARGRNRGRP